jgi:hypothetical protein
MRRVLMQTRHIDRQAEDAARRIATALDMDSSLSVKTAALSAVGELRIQIRDLQRSNLELQYQVDNPDFEIGERLDDDRGYISECSLAALFNRYNYYYFVENYHPDYVVQLCTLLCNKCLELKAQSNELWDSLLVTSGFITKDITKNFGPVETDKGII